MRTQGDPPIAVATEAGGTEVRVWDPLVRLFHRSLVSSVTVAFATGEHSERLHTAAGYTVMGLVFSRII